MLCHDARLVGFTRGIGRISTRRHPANRTNFSTEKKVPAPCCGKKIATITTMRSGAGNIGAAVAVASVASSILLSAPLGVRANDNGVGLLPVMGCVCCALVITSAVARAHIARSIPRDE